MANKMYLLGKKRIPKHTFMKTQRLLQPTSIKSPKKIPSLCIWGLSCFNAHISLRYKNHVHYLCGKPTGVSKVSSFVRAHAPECDHLRGSEENREDVQSNTACPSGKATIKCSPQTQAFWIVTQGLSGMMPRQQMEISLSQGNGNKCSLYV